MIPIPTRRQSLGFIILGFLIIISSIILWAFLMNSYYGADIGMFIFGVFVLLIIGVFMITFGNRQVIDMDRLPQYLLDLIRIEYQRLKKID